MSRAKTGAAAPHPTHHLVWGLLARARGAASWACSFGASWCSATAWRSRIPHACAPRRLRRASSRRCGQLYPPAARQDCGSSSIASHYRALLTRPQIGSGGRLLRRRSELWWCPRGAAYERHQTSAHEPRSSANVETSSLHREGPFDEFAEWRLSLVALEQSSFVRSPDPQNNSGQIQLHSTSTHSYVEQAVLVLVLKTSLPTFTTG